MHVSVCEGMLDRLILTDGSREDDSLAGVVGGPVSVSVAWVWKWINVGKRRDVLLQSRVT